MCGGRIISPVFNNIFPNLSSDPQCSKLEMLRLFRRERYSREMSQWAKVAAPHYIDSKSENNSRRSLQFQQRFYGVTTRRENPLIYGGIAVFVAGASAQMGMQAYEDYQANKAKKAQEVPEPEQSNNTNNTSAEGEKVKSENPSEEEAGESFFTRMFSTTYYEGGFESKMTRREAALILGVRESANEKRIKDAHRRILVKNHPDRGGSAFIASKVNEAKDFLLKGKSS